MNKITCLIVDDESVARKGLEKYVVKIPFLELVGSCKSALQIMEYLNNQSIDLLFLDINMPHIKGTDFLRTLPNAPHVVFTTAYSEYALESFDFDVIDYLVKPISFERFLQAANKAQRVLYSSPDLEDYVFISDSKKLIKVAYADIVYLESNQNYVNIITTKDKHMALMPLKKVLEQLPTDNFIQVHRQYAVNKLHVEGLEGNQLIVAGHKILVSRRMREDVYKKLIDKRMLK
ncbi:MAG: LytTR family DNA-binding domain-containing protein [Ekhidna sp.]